MHIKVGLYRCVCVLSNTNSKRSFYTVKVKQTFNDCYSFVLEQFYLFIFLFLLFAFRLHLFLKILKFFLRVSFYSYCEKYAGLNIQTKNSELYIIFKSVCVFVFLYIRKRELLFWSAARRTVSATCHFIIGPYLCVCLPLTFAKNWFLTRLGACFSYKKPSSTNKSTIYISVS